MKQQFGVKAAILAVEGDDPGRVGRHPDTILLKAPGNGQLRYPPAAGTLVLGVGAFVLPESQEKPDVFSLLQR